MMKTQDAKRTALDLLDRLIRIPSFSGEEKEAADMIQSMLEGLGLKVERKYNNIWTGGIRNKNLPTILLNSHIDTVRPGSGWTTDPFIPKKIKGKIKGLGSNDAGASVVSLLAVFILLKERELPYNLVYSATAEEEITGKKGIESILGRLGRIDLGIIGEPTGMDLAIAEKGLMVLDCMASGKRSHAALKDGNNAIYNAMEDIKRIRDFEFPEKSDLLGEVHMQVTIIRSGEAHNIIPEACSFVIDVRTNDCYTNKEVFDILKGMLKCEIKSRSFRLNPSSISEDHPVVRRARELNLKCYGSGTLSDQALMPFPTVKIGPGDPARSHTSDEYILEKEIYDGIDIYLDLISNLKIK
jgi:acetylornithine deacetylase